MRPLHRNRTKETVIATATCAPAAPCEDRRIAKSRRALRGALVELMEERGYDALTVNDLCERADTSRGTFYNHFRDKDGLLAVLEDEVMADLDALQGRMQSITLADMLAFRATGRPLPFLAELFDYLREQSDFLHAVLGRGCARRSARTWCRTSCMRNTATTLRSSWNTTSPSTPPPT